MKELEYSLEQYCALLPKTHRVNKELQYISDALDIALAEFEELQKFATVVDLELSQDMLKTL